MEVLIGLVMLQEEALPLALILLGRLLPAQFVQALPLLKPATVELPER